MYPEMEEIKKNNSAAKMVYVMTEQDKNSKNISLQEEIGNYRKLCVLLKSAQNMLGEGNQELGIAAQFVENSRSEIKRKEELFIRAKTTCHHAATKRVQGKEKYCTLAYANLVERHSMPEGWGDLEENEKKYSTLLEAVKKDFKEKLVKNPPKPLHLFEERQKLVQGLISKQLPVQERENLEAENLYYDQYIQYMNSEGERLLNFSRQLAIKQSALLMEKCEIKKTWIKVCIMEIEIEMMRIKANKA